MPDDKPVGENLFIVTTPYEKVNDLHFVKGDPYDVARKMAMPGHYTHLFSLSAGRPSERGMLKGAIWLLPVATRAPYLMNEGFETLLRTRWLGKAPETIEGEMAQLQEILDRIREESKRIYPVRGAGEAG